MGTTKHWFTEQTKDTTCRTKQHCKGIPIDLESISAPGQARIGVASSGQGCAGSQEDSVSWTSAGKQHSGRHQGHSRPLVTAKCRTSLDGPFIANQPCSSESRQASDSPSPVAGGRTTAGYVGSDLGVRQQLIDWPCTRCASPACRGSPQQDC